VVDLGSGKLQVGLFFGVLAVGNVEEETTVIV
jgi:hypothetical protein